MKLNKVHFLFTVLVTLNVDELSVVPVLLGISGDNLVVGIKSLENICMPFLLFSTFRLIF